MTYVIMINIIIEKECPYLSDKSELLLWTLRFIQENSSGKLASSQKYSPMGIGPYRTQGQMLVKS